MFGLPWWAWMLVVLGIGVAVIAVRNSGARAARRAESERLAQQADAAHEGARTRHEGGA